MRFAGRAAGIWIAVGLFPVVLYPYALSGIPALVIFNALFSLSSSLTLLAVRPKTPWVALLAGMGGGLTPGGTMIAIGLSQGVGFSCCGYSTGAGWFIAGLYMAFVGFFAGAWTGLSWAKPEHAKPARKAGPVEPQAWVFRRRDGTLEVRRF